MKNIRTSLALAILVSMGLSAPVMAQSMSHDQDSKMDSSQPGTDTWITTKVKADLLASGKTSGTDISVTTKDGVVWLSGHAATKAEKDRAVTEAKGIEGVKRVEASKLMVGKMAGDHAAMNDSSHAGMNNNNSAKTRDGMGSSQPGTDTWITTKVKADLLASGKTSGTDISVNTKNGVVWLSGHVATKAEKDRAVTEAKGIEGVKQVDASKLMVGSKM